MPGLLARVDRLSSNPEESEMARVEEDALRLKTELDGIGPGCSPEGHVHRTDSDGDGLLILSEDSETTDTPVANPGSLPDCCIISSSFYEMAQILLSWILSIVSEEPGSVIWEKELLLRCASLLDLADTIQSQPLSAVYPRLAMSMRTLVNASPNLEQRARAKGIVEGWTSNTAWGGFCSGIVLAITEDKMVTRPSRVSIRTMKIVE
jgi:hypothetical protein